MCTIKNVFKKILHNIALVTYSLLEQQQQKSVVVLVPSQLMPRQVGLAAGRGMAGRWEIKISLCLFFLSPSHFALTQSQHHRSFIFKSLVLIKLRNIYAPTV